MPFLLLNWKWILLGVLFATNAFTFKLWRGAVEDLTVFKAQVQVLGAAAEAEKKRIEALNATTLKEIKNAIPKQIATARFSAVRNYIASLPAHSSSSCLPGTPSISGRTDGAAPEPLLACSPGFVEDAAQDAATIELVQEWVRKSGLPVK